MTTVIPPGVLGGLPGIVAGFTTRAFAPADLDRNEHRRRLGVRVGMPGVAGVEQVHGGDVAVVRAPGVTPAHDGLATDQPELLLTVLAADCALILLADAEAGVVAACHSGWRGTVAGVARGAVETMRGLGARPAHTFAWIAPCISVEAFEVGEEVAAHFAPEHVVRRAEWPRPHVDLRAALRAQLVDAGLAAGAVTADEGCTALDTETFYSYRAEGGTAGRMIGYIGRRRAS